MKFYLGIHQPSSSYNIDVPYMISVRRLLARKKQLEGDWLLDSGGFSELSLHKRYTFSLDEYVGVIERMKPVFAFCMDWMCEEKILRKTGKNVRVHQWLTLSSFLDLEQRVGKKALPVLQGYKVEEYLRHVEDYVRAGIGFDKIFGLGSVCSRSDTSTPESIICALREEFPKIKLHGFGLKTTAFRRFLIVNNLYSADSMAWSFDARWNKGNGANSWKVALKWREKVLDQIEKTAEKPRFQTKLLCV